MDPSNASLNRDPLVYQNNSAVLGKVNYPDVGRNFIPVVQNKVTAADTGSRCIGLTLAQTALEDENGVTFYNDPRKADALGVIPSGGAVPVLVRGQVTLCETAFDTATITAPGTDLIISQSTAGQSKWSSVRGNRNYRRNPTPGCRNYCCYWFSDCRR